MGGTRARVLIVEDDRAMVGMLAMALGGDDCEIQTAYDGASALRRFETDRPDVVILDLKLPDMRGEDVCRHMLATAPVPILVLSGTSGEEHVARLLDLGADDYLAKPFRSAELLARVRAALRRATLPRRPRGQLVVGELVVDVAQHYVLSRGRPLQLSPTEFRLLERLASRMGELVTHAELISAAWPADAKADHERLKPHVARLRRKLAAGGAPTPRSVRGLGYQLD